MAAIVKANTSLTAGGLAVLRRTFQTTDRGQLTYNADYVCLAQFANTHAPRFRSGAQPPTPIPSSLLLLNLSRTPTLEQLDTVTENGLTYFRATYTAGVETDLVYETSSEQRNVAWRRTNLSTGSTDIYSFDYISISVTVTGTNTEIPIVRGDTGRVFNVRGTSVEAVLQNRIPNVSKTTIESSRSVRGRRGEYQNSATSTGIYEAFDETSGRPPSTGSGSSPRTQTFPNFNQTGPRQNITIG